MPSQPGAIQVTDRLERRIRKPIDLLRCVTSGIEIIVLAVAGDRGQRDHDRRGDRYHRRERAAAARPARGGTDPGPVRHPHHSRRAGRPPDRPAPGAESRRGRGYRPPGRVRGGRGQRRAAARVRRAALRRDHHVPAGRQPRRGARPVPGRPGGVRDDHRPVRAARLAERPVAGHRRLRPRAPGGDGHHPPVVPADPARRPHDRPRRPVRGGQPVAAAQRGGDRDRAEQRRPAADRDLPAPPGTSGPQAQPGRIASLRRDDEHRRPARCHRLRPGPAGGRRLLPAVPVAAAAQPGLARRAAVGGPDRGAPGAAVLRGRRRGRAHARAARGGPGRTGSHRARL